MLRRLSMRQFIPMCLSMRLRLYMRQFIARRVSMRLRLYMRQFIARRLYMRLAAGFALVMLGFAFIFPLGAVANDAFAELTGDTRTLAGEFVQTEYERGGVPFKKLRGKFKITNELKLRWEITDPPSRSQTIVSDGKEVKIYDKDLKQLIVRSLDKDRLPAFFFLANNPALAAQGKFSIRQPDPRQDSFVVTEKSGTPPLTVTFARGVPSEISWKNEIDERIVIKLRKIVKNRRISDREFRFTPPPGTDSITRERAGSKRVTCGLEDHAHQSESGDMAEQDQQQVLAIDQINRHTRAGQAKTQPQRNLRQSICRRRNKLGHQRAHQGVA